MPRFFSSNVRIIGDPVAKTVLNYKMMSKEANERLKRDTQHVPLRQNAEEKIREKGLKVV